MKKYFIFGIALIAVVAYSCNGNQPKQDVNFDYNIMPELGYWTNASPNGASIAIDDLTQKIDFSKNNLKNVIFAFDTTNQVNRGQAGNLLSELRKFNWKLDSITDVNKQGKCKFYGQGSLLLTSSGYDILHDYLDSIGVEQYVR